MALQVALPLLREAPHWIGSLRARSLWQVRLYVLCRANPKASICVVSPNNGSQPAELDPAALSVADPSTLDLSVIPMRFHPDSRAGLDLRPSCDAGRGLTIQQWLGTGDGLDLIPPEEINGIEVMRVRRRSDRMEFLVASSESAAEVIAAELIRSVPLWHSLATTPPSLKETVLGRML
ncbi:MAG: hypothetical protein ACKO0M_11945 [Cyanobium sp.]